MIRPRRALAASTRRLLRNVAGLGRVGERGATERYDTEHRRVDVLVDRRRRRRPATPQPRPPRPGRQRAARRRARRRSTRRAATRCSRRRARSAIYEGGLVPVDAGDVLLPHPRRAHRRRDRRARAAARLPRQRSRRRDAARRRSGASSTTGRQPGTRAVVVGATPERSRSPEQLERAGVEIAAVVDLRATPSRASPPGARRARCARSRSTARRIECDLLVAVRRAASPRTRCSRRPARASSTSRAAASSCPPTCPPGSRPSGRVAGDRPTQPCPRASYERRGDKCFVCVCEDVTVKDMKRAVAEGFDSIELAKRYTTVTMGPCQGKLCHLALGPAARARDRHGRERRSARRPRGRRGRRSSSACSPAATTSR